LTSAAAAVVAAWLASQPLRREMSGLRTELKTVEETMERLRLENDALRAAAGTAPGTVAGTAAGQFSLRDVDGPVTLSAERLDGLGALPSAYESHVRNVVLSRRLILPAATLALGGHRGSLRTAVGPPAFRLLSPVGTAVEVDRPVFRWEPLRGASTYTVVVSTTDFQTTDFQEVASSPRLSATEWKPSRPLPRGAAYLWQVRALRDGQEVTSPKPPEPEARFRVLDPEQAAELSKARQTYRSHLLLGILYAKAGLLDDAEKELEALKGLNQDSPFVKDLLNSLKARRS